MQSKTEIDHDFSRQNCLALLAALKTSVTSWSLAPDQPADQIAVLQRLIQDIEIIQAFYTEAFAKECLTPQFDEELKNIAKLLTNIFAEVHAKPLDAVQQINQFNLDLLTKEIQTNQFKLACYRMCYLGLLVTSIAFCFISPFICLSTNFLAGIFVFAAAAVAALYLVEKVHDCTTKMIDDSSVQSYRDSSQRFFTGLSQLEKKPELRTIIDDCLKPLAPP